MDEEPPDVRPAQRLRTSSQQPAILDEEHIRRNMSLPTKEEYPGLPAKLFSGLIVEQLNRRKSEWNLNLKLSRLVHMRGNMCKLTLTISTANGETKQVEGYGRNQKTAARAAYLHCFSYLHTSGTLRQIENANKLDGMNLDQQTLKEEADAQLEVYNYSARFGLIPQVSIRRVQRPHRVRRPAFEVDIKLPEQGIEVSSRAEYVDTAQIGASIKFKEAAEQFQAEHGDSSIVIRDQTALTTSNLRNFWDFLQLQKKKITVTAHAKQTNNYRTRFGNAMEGQAYVKSTVANNNAFVTALGGDDNAEEPKPISDLIIGVKKKTVEDTAYLVAAVKLCQEDPTLMDGFKRALSTGASGILMPLKPIDLPLEDDASYIMKDTLRSMARFGLPDKSSDIVLDREDKNNDRGSHVERLLAPSELRRKSEILKERKHQFDTDANLTELRKKRASLPMSQYAQQVLEQIRGHNYSVIVGATGSGKTTQVPQIVLDAAISQDEGAMCNVICTQPRRIAATSVARRVAEERNERLQTSVGYHVRFDPKRPHLGGSITYCTTGILLQQLQSQPDEMLDRVSHIVIDEVHERDILIDFLMIVVKRTIERRRHEGKSTPKVVLMSATIDSELFAKYFKSKRPDGSIEVCPSLSVPGRTFPVADKHLHDILQEMKNNHGIQMKNFLSSDSDTRDYLDIETTFKAPNSTSEESQDDSAGGAGGMIDWKRERRVDLGGEENTDKEDGLVPINLVAATIMHICKTTEDGALLVFLPGYDEMRKTDETLRMMGSIGFDVKDASKYRLHMLHSSVPADEQAKVFDKIPPGCRKIILSTNIAETSVTIPDVQFVIDTGKLREKRYDQVRRITKLQCTWVSKSNAKQRAGRAGRVQNGNYYALYSKERLKSLRAIGLPEMLRSDLQEVCLDIKAQRFNTPIRQFLSQAIEPPPAAAVEASVVNLKTLQALTEDENLTALGRLLASLPVHPSLGKMIVLGVIFRCLDPMIVLGAALSERSIFVTPPEKRREAQQTHLKFGEGTQSDHYALIAAFGQLRHVRAARGARLAQDYAFSNFLHMGAFKTIDGTGRQIEEILVNAGLMPKIAEHERFEGEYGHPSLNKNSTDVVMIKALTLAGVHPNLAAATGKMLFRTPGEKNTMIHPASLNYRRKERPSADSEAGTVLSYSTMARSNDGKSTFLRDTTMSTPLMAALFGGRLNQRGPIVEMDGWLPFMIKGRFGAANVLVDFRDALDRLLTKSFQDLAIFRERRLTKDVDGLKDSLADDKLRTYFADGLKDLLNLGRQKSGSERFADYDVDAGFGRRSSYGRGRFSR